MVYRVKIEKGKKPDSEELKKIAFDIWDDGNKDWKEFTVFIYLSDMDINSVAYAIGEFRPSGLEDFKINEWAIPTLKSKSVEEEENQDKSDVKDLSLLEITICENVLNKKPIKSGTEFYNDIDTLYCFTKFKNSGPKQEVRHVWFFENQPMVRVSYNVKKSKVYNSWTKKAIHPYQVGNWKVEIQNELGDIIGQTSFVIKEK